MTRAEVLEELELHARSAVVNVEPSKVRQWAEALKSEIRAPSKPVAPTVAALDVLLGRDGSMGYQRMVDAFPIAADLCRRNNQLEIGGIVRNCFDGRDALADAYLNALDCVINLAQTCGEAGHATLSARQQDMAFAVDLAKALRRSLDSRPSESVR
jgi:hypothetical protein